ncbi:hypothetical protein SELMODRAFT_419525 [Selaginella moellendorffii]|uniref:Uncharacterized protein n=1 Tax=Selaginella moellendorffii TaxID=88036 RepID=D8S979_SELML|nr:hypothetical protein SELMODRAFT_419525 [Selaginella moellendorffii]
MAPWTPLTRAYATMTRRRDLPSGLTTGATATRSAAGHAPSATRDDGVKPMSPMPSLDRKPMKARKRPIPAALELEPHRKRDFRSRGRRQPEREICKHAHDDTADERGCCRGDGEITLRLVQAVGVSFVEASSASNQAFPEPLKDNSRAWDEYGIGYGQEFSRKCSCVQSGMYLPVPGSFLKGFLMKFSEPLAGVKENEDASITAQMGGQFVSRPVIWNVEQEQLIAEELALFPRKRCGNRTILLSATRILYLA